MRCVKTWLKLKNPQNFFEEEPETIAYLNEQGRKVFWDGEYTVIDGSAQTLESGFYVTEGNVATENVITVRGDAVLCLRDGSSLSVQAINVSKGNSITITSEPGMSGKLYAGINKKSMWNAGIGAALDGGDAGTNIITGGTIEAGMKQSARTRITTRLP